MSSGLLFTLRDNVIFAKFEILVAVTTVFWDVTPFNLVGSYPRFRGTCSSVFGFEVQFFEICDI
jgi:hypothetical protein